MPELIPGSVPLTSVPGLNPAQIHTLNDLWIDTAQQLVGIYGTNEPTRSRLAAALGILRTALDPIVNAAQRMIPLTRDLSSMALELEATMSEHGFGALLDDPAAVQARMALLPVYRPSVRGPLPESCSLLHQLPPLRNQGNRSTCVAHAALAVREQLEIAAGAPDDLDLSEQYVYWWCKERDQLPGQNGTYLSLGMRCLREAGAPLESLWPHVSNPAGEQVQGPPPAGVMGGDPAFRVLDIQEFNRIDIRGLKACLTEGRAVAFSLAVFDSWSKSSAMARWGKITMPLAGEPAREGHAMTLVGYQDDSTAPGGGYFLVRNSWQPWAWDSVWAAGYGYIPYAYIVLHANTIFSAHRMPGAEVYLRDGRSGSAAPNGELLRNSPDVWLRQLADAGSQPQAPKAGAVNALYARVFNSGPACVYRVTVEIFHTPAALAPNIQDALPVGRLEAAIIWPGETILGPLMWTPPVPGPFAYLARASAGQHV